MTQLGEAVMVGMVDDDELECPFDHNPPPAKNGENKLIGKGGTLAQKMESGASTLIGSAKQTQVPNPKKVKSHPFFGGKTCVVIEVVQPTPEDEPSVKKQKTPVGSIAKPIIEEYAYKVSCAAHHCIPAQESLKESPLLAWMVKKDDPEELKDDKFEDGLVWADVGYDVNGSENGVWLPGNYAVCGSRNGSLWQSGDGDDDPDDEELEDINNPGSDYEADPASVAFPAASGAYQRLLEFSDPIDDDDPSNVLAGVGVPFSARPDSRKWRYVAQAMKLGPGQFHDRHEDYSAFVGDILIKIHQNYLRLERSSVLTLTCPDCKKRESDIKKCGTPTPTSLVPRLNGVAKRMRQMLSGAIWPENVYTSKWVRSYAAELKKAKVAPLKVVF